METGVLPTSMEVDGSTRTCFIASIEAWATWMEAGLIPTPMGVGGSVHGNKFAWKYSLIYFRSICFPWKFP